MFEEYLRDADYFFITAQKTEDKGNDQAARRFYRAAVFCTSSAIEAYVNYIGDSFAQAGTLPDHEVAFLNDKVIRFSSKTSATEEKTVFHRLDEKLRVIMKRFVKDFDFEGSAWAGLIDFKKFRNLLVHPRQGEDETPLSEYRTKIRKGLRGTILVMNDVSKGIYKKPLRRQLLDLVPD